MSVGNRITATEFAAFLKCPTKGYLMGGGEGAPRTLFTNVDAHILSLYKAVIEQQAPIGGGVPRVLNWDQLLPEHDHKAISYHVDCNTVAYDLQLSQRRPKALTSQKSLTSPSYVPVLLSPWEKPNPSDCLLICFGALALSQTTGILPDLGILIYGDSPRCKNVKIGDYLSRTYQTIEAIRTLRRSLESPPLVLNRHCVVCDFQHRCRNLAIERDELSLLSAMTAKERTKYAAKGVVTITQLSYGYRPRRRKRTRPDAERSAKTARPAKLASKNDHKLRALAIKKKQIHVVGALPMNFDGVPVFLDVEGMPDRDFYYLVGLRFESNGEWVECSFWADGPDDERLMWENCLQTLKAVGSVQIISYGAYEARFLRRMRERYILPPNDLEIVDRMISTLLNLVDCIYAKIYFPTYSNSLKDVARYLGYEWTWPEASGAAAPLVRRAWELGAGEHFKLDLISYNMDDCRAAATVTEALLRIGNDGKSYLNEVDVHSLEVGFQRTFGKLDTALPEFKKINDAAYWDYQRSKVYARTEKVIRRTVRVSQRGNKSASVEREIAIADMPERCPRCNATRLWTYRGGSNIVYDLKFTRRGIKRWAVRYRYNAYRCGACRIELTVYTRKSLFGQNLRAFVVYLLIELRLSNQKAADHSSSLFDVPLTKAICATIKEGAAEIYKPTYLNILREIAKGSLVHADETKGVVKGGGHYVWVFANLTTVGYVYAESRDSGILEDVLDGFSGVLVSDFYAAYDSVPCAQQKCLIHLMRDINEDLHKHPFDEELKEMARQFGTLLRGIVGTIDTYGLKARHLSKHRRSAVRFVEQVSAMKCSTEVGMSLQKRIEKNRDKLFTFLYYDGVPWNNNNAEHAVKAFTRLRNVIITSTPKGTREFATLLSIQQTLRYRGMGFLDFLRSGRLEIGTSRR
jgi:predicted RecB family nuclease